MTHVWLALPLILAGGAALLGLGRGLDALTLGEDAAEAMGLRLARLRLTLVLGTAAMVGAGVAVAGAIGFVGLVVPHLLRPLVGARPSRLLWASGLGGLILPERDLKLGVLTAIVGAPLFLHLIYKTRGAQA
jgi:iron complex transport system permease protein